MKKIIKWAMLIAWMIIIFLFSSQPAEISDEKSKLIIYLFDYLGVNLDSVLGELSNFAVRKTAHFIEYFILYMLIFNVVYGEFKTKAAILISISGVFLYACTDEFHQTFVPGRAGRFKDVLIDTTGGMAAAGYISIRNRLRSVKK